MSQCPCGSNKEFNLCCEPYITGKKDAPTAVATMRARYSSFVTANIDYIKKTHNPNEVDSFDEAETLAWAQNSDWKGLEILETEKVSDIEGTVEFVATYVTKNNEQAHHEVASFEKIDGFWYFMDGQIVRNSVKRVGPKVGRNDPCICGSGKKYKKCCL